MKNNLIGEKFYQYMNIKYYDKPNYFYAKIKENKELIECEIYNDNYYIINYTDYVIEPYYRDRPIYCPMNVIATKILEQNNTISNKIDELHYKNRSLLNKKQITINKIKKYTKLLEKIRSNNSYNFRKFRKVLATNLLELKDKIDSSYDLYNTIKYEKALKCNKSLVEKINKDLR